VLAVVSNQRGVARGLVTRRTLREVEVRIQRDLRPLGCAIDAFRYCVHEPHEGCECRKPRPGMLVDVAAALALDLPSSWMVGDAETDVIAGAAAGCRTALIGAGSTGARPNVVAPSLAAASAMITADVAVS
jgi:D-glycero-D-manno-heptose 1,7-bisphosphate phosphatase